jgi:hypothetical protein
MFSTAALFPYLHDGKLGYHDNSGTIVIPARFDQASLGSSGFFEGAAFVIDNGRAAFVDEKGAILFHPDPAFRVFHEVFSDGLLRFSRDGLYGFLAVDSGRVRKDSSSVTAPSSFPPPSLRTQATLAKASPREPALDGASSTNQALSRSPRIGSMVFDSPSGGSSFRHSLAPMQLLSTKTGYINKSGQLVSPLPAQ